MLDVDDAQKRVAELAEQYAFRVDPSAVVEDLSVGEEQRVEILKALYRGVDILILDEPTAVLTPGETQDLFEQPAPAARGRHARSCSSATSSTRSWRSPTASRCCAAGSVVGETTPAETSKAKLAEMMVGRPVLFRLEKPQVEIGEPILTVEGLDGRGQAERRRPARSARARSSASPASRATASASSPRRSSACASRRRAAIPLEGNDISGQHGERDPQRSASGYIPEDRHEQGLVLDMTLWENTVLGRQDDRGVLEPARRPADPQDQGARGAAREAVRRPDAQRRRDRLDAVRREPAEADPRARARDRPEAPGRRPADPRASTSARSSSSGSRSSSRRRRAGRSC